MENRCTTGGCTNVSEIPSRIYPTRTIEYYNSILMSTQMSATRLITIRVFLGIHIVHKTIHMWNCK